MASVENKFFNKQTLTVSLIVLVVIFSIMWLIYQKPFKFEFSSESIPQVSEGFANEEQQVNAEIMDKNSPFVDPKTGTLIDGPGFEKGEVDGVSQEVMAKIPSNYYFLDDGNDGNDSIMNNLCSKSCCSSQYPLPFKMKLDNYVCSNKDEFLPGGSNIMCNNAFNDSGCLCLTKKQGQALYNRYGNGREWF